MKIYEIKLRVKGDKSVWNVVHVRAKTIVAAIEKAVQKESKATGLELVCCSAVETAIELI